MDGEQTDILLISGSPRSRTCVALIELLESGAKKAGAKTQTFLLSKKRINPCIGCGACESTGNCTFAGKTHNGRFLDDYLELKAVLERVDAVAIVAPVYFAGPPSQLKALYDRMQPYWVQRYLLGRPARKKRPCQLFVVGSGDDAHGYAPLAGSTKSAMAVAGFNLEKVNNFIGFKDPRDVPTMPDAHAAESMNYSQLAQIKRHIADHQKFVERALDAGGAFARFVVKKHRADEVGETGEEARTEVPPRTKVNLADALESSLSGEFLAVEVSKEGEASEESKSEAVVEATETAGKSKRKRVSPAQITDDEEQASPETDEQKDFWRQNSLEFKNLMQAEIDQKYSDLVTQTPRKEDETPEDEALHKLSLEEHAKATGTLSAEPEATGGKRRDDHPRALTDTTDEESGSVR